ncbi:uncharacterized protein MKK02DRAFT_28703 [Dioszegia hungarica]|uniref:Uncharacterized protein n=1 Tax=Dioszegia hungarica TaxID=4972 RepID=A0AA38H5G7_9TREE|nr:uncharacterized protein MKK02DRAFT_28703 [Dioszegia hungarica]KAI9633967.1 hypothetical protein MKK02DRAFT_28703 [Dioszegia hungarica]
MSLPVKCCCVYEEQSRGRPVVHSSLCPVHSETSISSVGCRYCYSPLRDTGACAVPINLCKAESDDRSVTPVGDALGCRYVGIQQDYHAESEEHYRLETVMYRRRRVPQAILLVRRRSRANSTAMGTAGHTAFAAGQRTGLKDHDDFDATVKHTAQVVEGIMGPGARIYPTIAAQSSLILVASSCDTHNAKNSYWFPHIYDARQGLDNAFAMSDVSIFIKVWKPTGTSKSVPFWQGYSPLANPKANVTGWSQSYELKAIYVLGHSAGGVPRVKASPKKPKGLGKARC